MLWHLPDRGHMAASLVLLGEQLEDSSLTSGSLSWKC